MDISDVELEEFAAAMKEMVSQASNPIIIPFIGEEVNLEEEYIDYIKSIMEDFEGTARKR
jgi:hypothetical protein